MGLRTVLADALSLLRRKPRIFLPRLLTTAVWSFFWLAAIQNLTQPRSFTLEQASRLLVFVTVMIPVQVWVYNSYFVIVRQYHDDSVSLPAAFRDGLSSLLEGLAAFFLAFLATLVLAIPGMFLLVAGSLTGSILLAAGGIAVILIALLGTTVVFYFVPVSVVLGDSGFFTNIRDGLTATSQHRREVALITLLSFGILLATTAVEGGLKQIGTVGFFLGRGISAVISVYLLIVNPEMLLQLEDTEN